MKKDLQEYTALFRAPTELRAQTNRYWECAITNRTVTCHHSAHRHGVSSRVSHNGNRGFAAASGITDEVIRYTLCTAYHNALVLTGHCKTDLLDEPIAPGESYTDLRTNNNPGFDRELIDGLKMIDEHIQKRYTNLTSETIHCQVVEEEKSLITSEGGKSYSRIPRYTLRFTFTYDSGKGAILLADKLGGIGSILDTFDNPDSIFGRIDQTYTHLRHKADGKRAEPGIHDVIMDSRISGLLAHEAIGHPTEADNVRAGSVFADKLHTKVASDSVTIIDFAHHHGSTLCPAPVFVDDEGTHARDAILIENGFLKSFMHNRESSGYFESVPSGNARAASYADEPMIRMRNTAILPGASTLPDMISSIDNGYYLMKAGKGQADTTSEFTLGIVQGYEIRNGKLGKAIYDTTVSGIALDVLKTVSMVSNNMFWHHGNVCGKKQRIPVGIGGSAIKCRVNVGG